MRGCRKDGEGEDVQARQCDGVGGVRVSEGDGGGLSRQQPRNASSKWGILFHKQQWPVRDNINR